MSSGRPPRPSFIPLLLGCTVIVLGIGSPFAWDRTSSPQWKSESDSLNWGAIAGGSLAAVSGVVLALQGSRPR